MTNSRVPAGHPTGGQFSSRSHADGDELALPGLTVVQDALGESIVIDPSVWDAAAELAYSRGQCPALAAAIGDKVGLPVTVAMNRGGNILIHAWVDDGGFILDADGAGFHTTEDVLDEFYPSWGDVALTEMDPAELRAFVDAQDSPQRQNWDLAVQILPAWADAVDFVF